MAYRIIFIFFLFISFASAGERFAVAYNPDIDLTKSAKSFVCGDMNVYVDLSRPLEPFKDTRLIVKPMKNGVFVGNLKIDAIFNMKMDMGNFVYLLKNAGSFYQLNFILPKCIWGDKRWYLKIVLNGDRKLCEKILLFDMVR